jgi:nitrate reductase NapD
MVISSLLVDATPGNTEEVLRIIDGIAGAEAHGIHGNSIVVSIEAESIRASYAIATELHTAEGVSSVQLVYANFEDDPIIQRKLAV